MERKLLDMTNQLFISEYNPRMEYCDKFQFLKLRNQNLWRIKLMNNKRIIIGVTIGITAAILWSVVFINVLNSMAGIGIGICLGISFGISGSLIFSKKNKDK